MERGLFDELDWRLFGIICGLIVFIVTCGIGMVNSAQAKQDSFIQADHQEIIEIKTDQAAIIQHNEDEDKRLERMENKIDTLLSRGS